MFKAINMQNTSLLCYEITDDNFIIKYNGPFTWVDITNKIIEEYEKRNLNVAANLILWFRHYSCDIIQEQIFWATKHIENYDKYKDEIEKYLLLI